MHSIFQLPEKVHVSREARSAISKAASSFILCVTSMASAHCEAGRRKTLAASDIIGALRDMQFGNYESDLVEHLQGWIVFLFFIFYLFACYCKILVVIYYFIIYSISRNGECTEGIKEVTRTIGSSLCRTRAIIAG